MKIIRNLALISILLTFTITAKSQQIDKMKLVEDFNTFIKTLEDTHPDPYSAFGNRIEFNREAQHARGLITDDTSISEFRNIISSFLSVLGDGHTSLNENISSNNKNRKYLPLELKIAIDGIFICNTTNDLLKYKGAKIDYINGVSVDDLCLRVKKIYPCENKYGEYDILAKILSNNTSLLFENSNKLNLSITYPDLNKENIEVEFIENPKYLSAKSDIKFKKEHPLLFADIIGDKNKPIGYFKWNSISSREMIEEVAINPNQSKTPI